MDGCRDRKGLGLFSFVCLEEKRQIKFRFQFHNVLDIYRKSPKEFAAFVLCYRPSEPARYSRRTHFPIPPDLNPSAPFSLTKLVAFFFHACERNPFRSDFSGKKGARKGGCDQRKRCAALGVGVGEKEKIHPPHFYLLGTAREEEKSLCGKTGVAWRRSSAVTDRLSRTN